jgi:Uma2 family endonuclease
MIIVNNGCSLEHYWDVEDRTEYKNEYIDGQIISRIGTCVRHVEIGQNLGMDLYTRSEHLGWCAFMGMRLKVEQTGAYVWPDVMVYDLPGRFEVRRPNDDESLIGPSILIEVFSPLTESLDRGTKWAHYRTIPSLREYVLVAQDKVSVERYVRQEDDWLYSAITDQGGTLRLDSIGYEIPVREIYDRVELPAERRSMLIPPVDLLR